MKRIAVALCLITLLSPLQSARSQTLNARRMGMGGVVVPGGGSEGFNPAYRAAPLPPDARRGLPLPIGLIPLLANPPVLDPDDPEFNIYELANQVYNPPWNLQLISPQPPSNDIVVELGRDHLAIELGELGRIFPSNRSVVGALTRAPSLGFAIRNFFLSAGAVAHYENELTLNEPLYAALARGESFQTNTQYELDDDVLGQAAASMELGWAGSLLRSGEPRLRRGMAVVGGVRTKLLRGLAYGDVENTVSFSTSDTLFSNSPINLDYLGVLRTAGSADGGWGHGLDLGAVWILDGFEAGLGVNDVVSRLGWKVEESVARRDSAAGDFARVILARDVPFTSQLPRTATLNLAYRFGRTLLAADVIHGMEQVTGHLGAETWFGFLALRGGAGIDANEQLQLGGGMGVKLGRVGVDLAVATNSRNLTRERGVELGAGLALYP